MFAMMEYGIVLSPKSTGHRTASILYIILCYLRWLDSAILDFVAMLCKQSFMYTIYLILGIDVSRARVNLIVPPLPRTGHLLI